MDTTILVPIMLFGWVFLTIIAFLILKPHRAVLFSVIGGWLLLPTFSYDVLGLPEYSKSTSIALGLILGDRLSDQRQAAPLEWKVYDLPMILWCLCPIATSLMNQLGLYDGLSDSFNQIMVWGVPYLAGRIYFNNSDTLRDLCLGIIIGGLLYALLCLYEIRMSPQLNKTFYGFFQSHWVQHYRYGGWRPIVFMQHGLMVSLWMAISSIVAFWFWRSRDIVRLKGIPMSFIVMALVITAMLCKSANGWFALAIGCGSYFIHRSFKTNFPFLLLLLLVPLYIGLRVSGFILVQDIEMMAANFFDAERVGSLCIRLLQEDLFIQRAMERPMFGWGGYSRGWPVDPNTGELMIKRLDSLWLITFSKYGFLGIISFVSALLIGPWLILRSTKKNVEGMDTYTMFSVVLSLAVVLFMIDSLFNGMINPVYIMSSGTLVSWYLIQKQEVLG